MQSCGPRESSCPASLIHDVMLTTAMQPAATHDILRVSYRDVSVAVIDDHLLSLLPQRDVVCMLDGEAEREAVPETHLTFYVRSGSKVHGTC